MHDSKSGPHEDVLALRKQAAAFRDGGRLAEAVAALARAVQAGPADADAHAELGLTLLMARKAREAEAFLRRALELGPDDVFTLSNLGAALLGQKRGLDAEPLFRRVLELEPGQPQAMRNLAHILKDAGRLEEAKAFYGRVAAVDGSLQMALHAHVALSPLPQSPEAIAEQRRSYAEGLEAFAADPATFAYEGEQFGLPWFHLAYHGQDDRALIWRTGEVMAAKVGPWALSPNAAPPRPAAGLPERRIRVAFCSQFFSEHTIGRLNRGFIERLDRSRFEVMVMHGSHAVADAFRAGVDALADRAIVLPRQPEAQHQLIAQLAPDVLFYPDVGMAAQTWFLARTRLAPVQAAGWGHPETTGLAAIDYFISADAAEPAGAEAAYGERLVRMPRLPACYEAMEPAAPISKAELGLPETGRLYGCPQNLFKLHPDFDAVLAGIIEADPSGWIVLLGVDGGALRDVLLRRLAGAGPRLLERICFLPRMTHARFMAHLAHLDVVLDPLHFGSGNTLYEAMSIGAPIVTWPGRFMRGRLVSAAYRQMGVAEAPVADSPADYAPLAVALARDPERRGRLQAELKAKARTHLFSDAAAVRDFEAFLSAAVLASSEGRRLPAGWRPHASEAAS